MIAPHAPDDERYPWLDLLRRVSTIPIGDAPQPLSADAPINVRAYAAILGVSA
jgi:hypothetical protein